MPTAAGIESLARRSQNPGQSQIGGRMLESARRFANKGPRCCLSVIKRVPFGTVVWRSKIAGELLAQVPNPSHQSTIIPELPNMNRLDVLLMQLTG